MFIQNYLNGKIYKSESSGIYTLKIGRKSFSGDSLTDLLSKFSKYEHKKTAKRNKKTKQEG